MRSFKQSLILCTIFGNGCLLAQTTAITNVTIINPRDKTVEHHQTVLIKGKRITAVQPLSARIPADAIIVAGAGKFLIPGLWDAHVHLTKLGILSLPLFIANGVTSVRDMGSDLAEVARWRSQIESGRLIGPHIKTPGQMLESRANVDRMKREHTVEPVDRLRIGVGNPAEGRAAVDRLAAAGVDHIKMRTTPDLATFLAVGDEARRRHLPFAAHPVASPDELIQAHLRSVEHFLAYPPITLPREQRELLFRRIAASGMFMSNTMANLPGLELPVEQARARLNDTTGKLDPLRKYVCGYLVEDWREQAEELKDYPKSFRTELIGEYKNFQELREAAVPFLAGTDTAVLFMYPGFSLHNELHDLVTKVGFTPMDVLRIATYNPFTFYGEDRDRGTIQVGQPADLVLLDADPVADIRNTKKIRGVMVSGRYFDRASLNSLLAEVEQHAQANCDEPVLH